MTTPIIIARGADGGPLLTVAQAVAVAKLSLPEGRHNPEGMAILGALWEQGEDTHSLLASIIIEWAPMVAAVRQPEAGGIDVPPFLACRVNGGAA